METLEATLDALYASISFAKGTTPRLDLLRSLFLPQGLLINNTAPETPVVMSVEDFCGVVDAALASGNLTEFHEKEIARTMEVFGNIAHVFSTYEARFDEASTEPFSVGINTIQFIRTNGVWQVSSMAWNDQTAQMLIPPQYL
ncbi:MAG: hypothetical protein EAZ92_07230 [Candidatus Kapaibacterium sp.]|nr:MAG: hypothetical protein EAZ92_07230 [Candidatus Kapabacteria bacterium]